MSMGDCCTRFGVSSRAQTGAAKRSGRTFPEPAAPGHETPAGFSTGCLRSSKRPSRAAPATCAKARKTPTRWPSSAEWPRATPAALRSEEHTSELQSPEELRGRLLHEEKKKGRKSWKVAGLTYEEN